MSDAQHIPKAKCLNKGLQKYDFRLQNVVVIILSVLKLKDNLSQ